MIILCKPGDNLHALATSHAPGDLFWLTKGTYYDQRILPLDAQTFVGEPGAILDGTGSVDYAFHYDDHIRHPCAVTLRGLTVQHYTGGEGRGMIYAANGKAWTLDQLLVRGCTRGRGIDGGPGMRVRACRVVDNYLQGLNAWQAHGLTIEHSEFAGNNTSGRNPDTADGEGGGLKLGACIGARVLTTYVHDNHGPGIWFDVDCHDGQVIGCTTQRNAHYRGIQVEISDLIQILTNTCIAEGIGGAPPGAAGVFVSSSSRVEVAGNRFLHCAQPISTWDDPDRGSGPYGPHRLTDFNPHDNVAI